MKAEFRSAELDRKRPTPRADTPIGTPIHQGKTAAANALLEAEVLAQQAAAAQQQ